jgi:hypothetical protein
MMNHTFLEYVAKYILAEYGTDLSRVAVVFPNKRASLFLNQALIHEVGHPIWSPAYITISDLFRAHSSLQVPEQIDLVFRLYDVYHEIMGGDETLDHFFGWGQVMLSDFDDIDKNMVEASKLFVNLKAWQDMKDFSFLSDAQRESLESFFNIVINKTPLEEEFRHLWDKLNLIYDTYRSRLESEGLAYEGMLYRSVVEDPSLEFQYDHYLFVGFNLLQKVEQQLFRRLREEGKAEFFWDYDKSYLNTDTGKYIKGYLDSFPNALNRKVPGFDVDLNDIYNQMSAPKDICYLSANTETAQAAYISTWLQDKERIADGNRTAIVLADENLLQTVVQSLPDNVDKLNITTGYPLKASPVSAFVEELIDLQLLGKVDRGNKYRLKYVLRVLRHPLAKYLSAACQDLASNLLSTMNFYPTRQTLTEAGDDALKELFTSVEDNPDWNLIDWLSQLLKRVGIGSAEDSDQLIHESIFRMYTLLNRLNALVVVDLNPRHDAANEVGHVDSDGRRHLSLETTRRLMRQLVQSCTVPFHGEPAVGLQIMGVLETRNLDFDHVLLLSCNEGNLPKGVNDTSLIPHSLRKAYELTTVENKVAIYSYYFHSLVQRASDVAISYNAAVSNGQKGEMSRFMLQLLVERPDIRRLRLHTGDSVRQFAPQPVEKTGDVLKTLADISFLSPSAINRYLRCPLQFYFYSIRGLKEPDETDEEDLDQRTFGNIFHEAAHQIYDRLSAHGTHTITSEELKQMHDDDAAIDAFVDRAFAKVIFNSDNCMPITNYNGLQIFHREVIKSYLKMLFNFDAKMGNIDIVSLEKSYRVNLSFNEGTYKDSILVGGVIDRLDRVRFGSQSCYRVIDYKTGGNPTGKPQDIDEIFNPESIDKKHTGYYLQAFLYSYMINRKNKEALATAGTTPQDASHALDPVVPALLFVRQANQANYNPNLSLKKEDAKTAVFHGITEYEDKFIDHLKELLREIFNPELPFTRTIDTSRCANCIYKEICG